MGVRTPPTGAGIPPTGAETPPTGRVSAHRSRVSAHSNRVSAHRSKSPPERGLHSQEQGLCPAPDRSGRQWTLQAPVSLTSHSYGKVIRDGEGLYLIIRVPHRKGSEQWESRQQITMATAAKILKRSLPFS